MRVLILTTIFPGPGAPIRGIYNLHWAAALANHCEVRTIVPTRWWTRVRRPHTLFGIPKESFGEIPCYYPTYWFGPRAELTHDRTMYASVLPLVRRMYGEFPFDAMVGAFAYPDAAAASYLADAFDCPLITKVLGSDINLKPEHSPAMRERVRKTLRRAQRVVAVSESLRERLIGLGVDSDRAVVCHNGVNGERFSPRDRSAACARLGLPSGGSRIGFVGNFEHTKGVDLLIEAFAQLLHSGASDLELIMVGDGSLKPQMISEVARMGFADRVRFCGRRTSAEIPDWIAACDLICLPSRHEGCPNVVLEALACGRPVVGAAVGGVPELLDDRNGILVPPENPAALAAGLRFALGRAWDADELRRTVPHLSWDHFGSFMHEALDQSLREWRTEDRSAAPAERVL